MEFPEGKEKFLQAWGTLGTSWGISRTMAQIHALLLISPDALSADDVMEELKISRGNANMNLRALIDWGLVNKALRPGERREFFVAEKDMWTVVKNIIVQRKKRELEPMIRVLDELANVRGEDEASREFIAIVKEIRLFSNKADATLDSLVKADASWFMGTFLKMIR
ncbi:MAG: GbsR/MarR family transcriptional regulator [Saprospiraceae bacterium]|jgi:DNA-binding transcriptional regulator GbsR (MarR family)